MSASRPPGRLAGDWLVATMIYDSTREARVPGFDSWYWGVLALLPRASRVLVIAGAYDSDGTIQELVAEARKRGKPVTVHFVENGQLSKVFELKHTEKATVIEDLDTFAEHEGIRLDDDGDSLTFNF